MSLTSCGYEVKETLLGEQWIFKPPEVELEDPGHRVDVMVSLIVHQRILTLRHKTRVIHTLPAHCC